MKNLVLRAFVLFLFCFFFYSLNEFEQKIRLAIVFIHTYSVRSSKLNAESDSFQKCSLLITVCQIIHFNGIRWTEKRRFSTDCDSYFGIQILDQTTTSCISLHVVMKKKLSILLKVIYADFSPNWNCTRLCVYAMQSQKFISRAYKKLKIKIRIPISAPNIFSLMIHCW